jgi:hypothetical protein
MPLSTLFWAMPRTEVPGSMVNSTTSRANGKSRKTQAATVAKLSENTSTVMSSHLPHE